MFNTSHTLIVMGSLLLLGLATDYLGRVTTLPRVTLLMLFGVLLGSGGLALLPESTADWFPLITNMALLLIGFLLGGKISISQLLHDGKEVLCLSLSVVLVTVTVVASGLWLFGLSPTVALLFAGIATATDPAATMDVIKEGNAEGKFTQTLLGIVAIDDAWGLIIFSVILALVQFMVGVGEPVAAILGGARELFGSITLGLVIGIPSAFLTGRIKQGEPTLVEALGVVFLCGGLAGYFHVSFLLTAMVLGATVSNLAKHHEQPFHEIEDIEWPFMILFFVLTGASLEIEQLGPVLPLAIMYIALRTIGRFAGSGPGAWFAECKPGFGRWMGLALLPQAGVANGMALLASAAVPEFRSTLLPVTIISTVYFELAGPMVTKMVLRKVGDIH